MQRRLDRISDLYVPRQLHRVRQFLPADFCMIGSVFPSIDSLLVPLMRKPMESHQPYVYGLVDLSCFLKPSALVNLLAFDDNASTNQPMLSDFDKLTLSRRLKHLVSFQYYNLLRRDRFDNQPISTDDPVNTRTIPLTDNLQS